METLEEKKSFLDDTIKKAMLYGDLPIADAIHIMTALGRVNSEEELKSVIKRLEEVLEKDNL